VCSGLLSHVDDHQALVMRFAQWQLQKAQHIADLIEHPFGMRVSVCAGPLLGGVAGDAAMRYVIAGPALDVARWALARCEANAIVTSDARAEATGWGAAEPTVEASTDDAPDGGTDKQKSSVPSSTVEYELQDDEFETSAVSLRFRQPAVREAFDAFMKDADGATRYTAAILVLVSVTFLAVVLLERAADSPLRHHDSPLALSFLGAAIGLSAAHLAIRLGGLALPTAADYAIIFVALASLSAALLTLNCVWLNAAISPYFCMGIVSHFRRILWGAQYALSFVALVGPVTIILVLAPSIRFKLMGAALAVLSVVHRYHTVRTDCMRFVATALSRRTLAAATELSTLQASLLAGLIPPHARAHAVPTCVELGANGVPGGVAFSRSCNGLSVLQLRLHMASKVFDFAGVAGAYSIVTEAVAAHGGRLELVQATGDTFLVVGPFAASATDDDRCAAAKNAVATLRALALALSEGTATFVAVATSGSAFAALIGAAELTFRIFGAAVRESNALLAAAPRPVGGKRNVAFASEAFRRQECNYLVPRGLTAAGGSLGWSMAMRPPSLSAAAPATVQPHAADEASFGPRVVWRVRGVGVMEVSSLVL
jgi:class 3 adenylate cyclase